MNWFKHNHSLGWGDEHWWFGFGYDPDFMFDFHLMVCPVHGELWLDITLGCFYLKGGYSR